MKNKAILNSEEEKIIREQIQKNTKVIDWIIYKVDLLVNKEGHKNDSKVVIALRKKLSVLMEENDTFRRVFWKHVQQSDVFLCDGTGEAVRYLILKMTSRQKISSSHGLTANYEIGTAVSSAA